MNVSVQKLGVRMGGTPVLENLDLDVVDGEFLVLLGPSGCGKSTLLHAIAGLIDVEAGAVHIGGKDVTWADPKDRAIRSRYSRPAGSSDCGSTHSKRWTCVSP